MFAERASKKLAGLSNVKQLVLLVVSDIGMAVLSLYAAFLIRFEFNLSDEYRQLILMTLPVFIPAKLISLTSFRLYSTSLKYFGLSDVLNIAKSVIAAETIIMLLVLNVFTTPFIPQLSFLHLFTISVPRSVFIIDGILSMLLFAGTRASKRVFSEIAQRRRMSRSGVRTIIVGAGNTGDLLLRDILRPHSPQFHPIGLLDDNKQKIGTLVNGIKVLGVTTELREMIVRYRAAAVIIAIPSLNYKVLRRIFDDAHAAGVDSIKIIPRIYDFHKPEVNLKDLEEISIEDLIGRQTVMVDREAIGAFLRGQVVLITGAGGSIGSEISLQICGFEPERVVLFDIDETALHNLRLRIGRTHGHLADRIVFAVGDIRDADRVQEVCRDHRPGIVFHAAAYKHVPMMEHNPREAVKANILGTYETARAAVDCGAQKFIMISTDKAVRPTSIMGATKRMAENVCRSLSGIGTTEFIAVRFGNVLGSRGSVLPLFLDQLKYGGPLTVTHRDMQRYFMTIPEAVSLVLQASVIGKGGEIMVLDMGVPITIVKLAEELIRLHGLQPYQDIDIQFTGMRPGEKLFEELLTAEEGTIATVSDKVFIARSNDRYAPEVIEDILDEFRSALNGRGADQAVRELLRKHVPHYNDAQQP